VRPHPLRAEETKRITLKAFADTIIPGSKRGPDDVAIAGAGNGPGAVAAGALELLVQDAIAINLPRSKPVIPDNNRPKSTTHHRVRAHHRR
jgi:hypothetical protein